MRQLDENYDVIIVGAGPAGIFSILELLNNEKNSYNILILEKGNNIDKRKCPMRDHRVSCQKCKPCSLLSGWGGAGAFSDGKLNLTSSVGGNLSDFISEEELSRLIDYVDDYFIRFGADKNIFEANRQEVELINKEAEKAGLKFIPTKIRHLGTENCFIILKNIHDYLKKNTRISIQTSTEVDEIIEEDGHVKGVITRDGRTFVAEYVILSPGRSGAEWLVDLAKNLKLKIFNNPVDVGIRVELPANILERLTRSFYELKLVFNSNLFNDKVRTFCMCPNGEVVMEFNNGITTVNGHSYREHKTENTNFALLVSTNFTEPFKEPIAYGKYIANLANLLSGDVLVQRLGDLISGRRSTKERINNSLLMPTLKSATPGDLSFVFPYRILNDIIEMLKALDRIAPGVYHKQTLLYGVEVKFYSVRLELSENLETKIKNLFAIGDGAGITRGLVQASVSGVIAAKEIKKRMSKNC